MLEGERKSRKGLEEGIGMGCWDDECEYCMQEEREIDEMKPDWEERRPDARPSEGASAGPGGGEGRSSHDTTY